MKKNKKWKVSPNLHDACLIVANAVQYPRRPHFAFFPGRLSV